MRLMQLKTLCQVLCYFKAELSSTHPIFIFSALYLVNSVLTLISSYKVQANDFFTIYFRYLLGLLALTTCFCCPRLYCFPALRVLALI